MSDISVNMNVADRDIRQRALAPPARLANTRCLVLGIGAGGRQVSLQLAALGAPELWLWDDDKVSAENLAPQGYWPKDLGRLKVDATRDNCLEINPDCAIIVKPCRFKRDSLRDLARDDKDLVVFCCVDSIVTRKMIWETVQPRAMLFLDGRMTGEVIRVLVSAYPHGPEYATTLFPGSEAHPGACTAKSTIYCANISAGLRLHQFTRWLRNLPTEPDQLLNLLAAELSVGAS